MDLLSTSQLFPDSLAQRRYLRNVAPSTIEWYETAFKRDTRVAIVNVLGEASRHVENFERIRYGHGAHRRHS